VTADDRTLTARGHPNMTGAPSHGRLQVRDLVFAILAAAAWGAPLRLTLASMSSS
jgi:hypothetical protein